MSRPSGDPGASAWEALLRAHAAALPAIARTVVAAGGIPLSWYDVLLELSRAPDGSLRMVDLGRRVVLSRSRVSRIVDEMEPAGYVTRVPDVDDGRATLAAITDDGRRALRQTAPIYLAAIEEHFARHLGAGEAKAIADGLNRIVAAVG